jgi:hypothetical protein
MFNLYGNERLTEWKRFRDSLESSNDPLTCVAELWATAPFVNSYLDPNNPIKWPDPWHLVLDSKLDELAICLGMLYTVKLTQRFMDTDCEIHMSMPPNNSEPSFYLVVDQDQVLNFEPRVVHSISVLDNVETNTLWRCDQRL